MVQLGEWSVVAHVPTHVSDEGAEAIAVAVTERLRGWTADAQEQVSRDHRVTVSLQATDPSGI